MAEFRTYDAQFKFHNFKTAEDNFLIQIVFERKTIQLKFNNEKNLISYYL